MTKLQIIGDYTLSDDGAIETAKGAEVQILSGLVSFDPKKVVLSTLDGRLILLGAESIGSESEAVTTAAKAAKVKFYTEKELEKLPRGRMAYEQYRNAYKRAKIPEFDQLENLEDYSFARVTEYLKDTEAKPGAALRMGDTVEGFAGWKQNGMPVIIWGILQEMTTWLSSHEAVMSEMQQRHGIDTGSRYYKNPDKDSAAIIDRNQNKGVLEYMLAKAMFKDGYRGFWGDEPVGFHVARVQHLDYRRWSYGYRGIPWSSCPSRSPEP